MTHHNAAGLVPGNTNNASTSLHSNDTIGIVQQGLDVYIELLCAAAGIAGGANSQGMKVAKLSVVSVFVGYVWARKACMSEIYTGVYVYDIYCQQSVLALLFYRYCGISLPCALLEFGFPKTAVKLKRQGSKGLFTTKEFLQAITLSTVNLLFFSWMLTVPLVRLMLSIHGDAPRAEDPFDAGVEAAKFVGTFVVTLVHHHHHHHRRHLKTTAIPATNTTSSGKLLPKRK